MNSEQELNAKFHMFEQQIQHLNKQLQAVEEGIVEMGILSTGLEDLRGMKDKEILAPFGRGIFVKAKLLSEDLIVDVGGRNMVTKDIDGTKKTISDQVVKLEEVKEELVGELQKVDKQITETMEAAKKKMDDSK